MNRPWLKRALPWALYDWANSAFTLTLMAAFVPVLNKEFWSTGAAPGVATLRLASAGSTAAILVALLAPASGAIADRGGAKKKFLAFFAATGIAMTASLPLAASGQWGLALTIYALACVGFSGANVFYDSLPVNLADEDKFDVVSALGYSLGYIGGALLFAFNIWMCASWATRCTMWGSSICSRSSWAWCKVASRPSAGPCTRGPFRRTRPRNSSAFTISSANSPPSSIRC
jgi:MFS-type transporter involved in bile tolerance (Atg22 family)